MSFFISGIMYTVLTSTTVSAAWGGTNSLGNAVIPSSVTDPTTSVPYTVTLIADNAFINRTSITSITIPASVTRIGIGAFRNCTGLQTVTITQGVQIIDDYAFQGCDNPLFNSITIPASVTRIGKYAFFLCYALTTVTITDGVLDVIDDYAFFYCNNALFNSITIPASVTRIGVCAFYLCSGLTTVTFRGNPTTIATGAFSAIASQSTAYIPSTFTNSLTGLRNIICINAGIKYPLNLTSNPKVASMTLAVNADILPASTILSTIRYGGNRYTVNPSIPANMFLNCTRLTSITIPWTATSIGAGAFTGCANLQNVTVDLNDSAYKSQISLVTIMQRARLSKIWLFPNGLQIA